MHHPKQPTVHNALTLSKPASDYPSFRNTKFENVKLLEKHFDKRLPLVCIMERIFTSTIPVGSWSTGAEQSLNFSFINT